MSLLTTEAHCLGFLPSKNAEFLAKQPKKKTPKNMTWHCPHRLAKKNVGSNLIFTQSSENRHAKLAGLNFEMYLTLLYAWWNWHAIIIALFLSVIFFQWLNLILFHPYLSQDNLRQTYHWGMLQRGLLIKAANVFLEMHDLKVIGLTCIPIKWKFCKTLFYFGSFVSKIKSFASYMFNP